MAVLKVLVIDDEPGIRSGVTRILRNFHVTYPFMDEDYTFEVTEAGTGEEGIAMIEKEIPDILLLDNKLPGMQGVEVLDIVRKRNYDIFVAMITRHMPRLMLLSGPPATEPSISFQNHLLHRNLNRALRI